MISNLHPFARAVVELFPHGECKTVVVFVLCIGDVGVEETEGERVLKTNIVKFAAVKQRIMI